MKDAKELLFQCWGTMRTGRGSTLGIWGLASDRRMARHLLGIACVVGAALVARSTGTPNAAMLPLMGYSNW